MYGVTSWKFQNKINYLILEVVGLLERYYCEQCRLLYDKVQYCKACGSFVCNKIKIEVQKQPEK